MKKPLKIISGPILVAAFAAFWILRWPLLQALAWCKMLLGYSLEFGIAEGFHLTFGGKNPCSLCRAAQAGAESDGSIVASILTSPLVGISLALLLATTAVTSLSAHRTAPIRLKNGN